MRKCLVLNKLDDFSLSLAQVETLNNKELSKSWFPKFDVVYSLKIGLLALLLINFWEFLLDWDGLNLVRELEHDVVHFVNFEEIYWFKRMNNLLPIIWIYYQALLMWAQCY